MATSSKEGKSQVPVEQDDLEAVLAVISASPSVTIEELLHHLPWNRWGHLFSILGQCLQEGSVILSQKEFQFEVRALNSSQSGSGENVLTGVFRQSREIGRWLFNMFVTLMLHRRNLLNLHYLFT